MAIQTAIEWYTPRKYLDAAIQVMGAIDLDPASSAAAQKHVQAGRYYTMEDDGLKQRWQGRVFLHPPHAGKLISSFTGKMVESWKSGDMTEGILLTVNATDTKWFQSTSAFSSAICFTQGRISFLEAWDGEVVEKTSPTHGQLFFYFGGKVELFTEVFFEFGSVVRPYDQIHALPIASKKERDNA